MVPQAEVKKQPEPLYYPLRFRLRKDGALRYISHLDFVRTMTKVLMRSGLPLWFTLGFNPIPKITFAAPLSVFMDSDCELMDVRMNTPVAPEEAKGLLAAVLPADMEVLEVYVPAVKLAEIGYIAYDLTVAYDGASKEDVDAAISFLASPSIMVEKKGKGDKIKEIDLKPMIASATLGFDEATGEMQGRWVLSASPEAFLNPELLLGAIKANTSFMDSEEVFYRFRRREVYAKDLSVFR